jgi:sugar phosphate isomerase/epimerase
MSRILKQVHVNIPYTMLKEGYLSRFLERDINPEIGFDAGALDAVSETECREIALKIHEHPLKLTLHAPFVDLSPGSPDPSVRAVTRQRFEQLLRVAELFHPLRIVCHAGYDWKRYLYLREQWMEHSLNTWKWMAKRTASVGAALMLENVYERGPEEMAPLFTTLRVHGVGFCLDTGHQAAFGSTPLLDWVEALGPFLGQLHLHDNLGRWDDHLAVGEGTIDFEGLFKALRKIREEPPPITLEPHRETDLTPSLEYLEKIWPWPR